MDTQEEKESQSYTRLMAAAKNMYGDHIRAIDVAQILCVSSAALANWKARGLSRSAIELSARKFNVSTDYLASGAEQTESDFLKVFEQLSTENKRAVKNHMRALLALQKAEESDFQVD